MVLEFISRGIRYLYTRIKSNSVEHEVCIKTTQVAHIKDKTLKKSL